MIPLRFSNNNSDSKNSGLPPSREFFVAKACSPDMPVQEITDRESDFYKLLVENINEAILLIDEKGQHVYRNPAVRHISGFDTEDLRDKTVFDFIHPDDVASAKGFFAEVVGQQGKSAVNQYRILKKDGSYVWVEGTVVNMLGHPIINALMINYRDVSKRKAAEAEVDRLRASLEETVALRTRELEQANEELTAFNYTVSHDLRSPLRLISGYTSVLERDYAATLNDEGLQMLRSMRCSAQWMNNMITELLGFSMAGKKTLEVNPIDMRQLIESVITEQRVNQMVSTEVQINHLEPIKGDVVLVRLALSNLLSNAFKYSSKNPHPKVTIGSERKDDKVVYFIKDNGDGFDNGRGEELFKTFSRLHSNDEFEGVGIGLSVVKRAITRHKGEVWAEGEKGKGATFYFSLPHNA
ncbi:MAG: PAS domain S-box protein [Chitinophagales bacterium]|nr:PAS domain S-box protein [Chitinophagales bacterium]